MQEKSSDSIRIPVEGDIAKRVRNAILRANELRLTQRQIPKKEKLDEGAIRQQILAILVSELHNIGLFPEEAYDKLYQYSNQINDESYCAEELIFLDMCIN